MNINVFEITGKAALSKQNGEKLYGIIKQSINNADIINLDFNDVKIFATPFLNASLGRLTSEYTREKLLQIINIQNITKNGESLINTSLESSEDFTNSKDYDDKILDTLNFQRSEEDDYKK